MLEIWTDGACQGNGKKDSYGGWAYIVYRDKQLVCQRYGSELNTTNNRMELKAVLEGFRYAISNANFGEELKIFTDSAYIVNCLNKKWYRNWQNNGWYSSQGTPVKNREIWEQLLKYCSAYKDFEIIKVKGHRGIASNELADMLAVKGANEARINKKEKK